MGATPSREAISLFSYFRGSYEVGLIPLTSHFFGRDDDDNSNGARAPEFVPVGDSSGGGLFYAKPDRRQLRRQLLQMRTDPAVLYSNARDEPNMKATVQEFLDGLQRQKAAARKAAREEKRAAKKQKRQTAATTAGEGVDPSSTGVALDTGKLPSTDSDSDSNSNKEGNEEDAKLTEALYEQLYWQVMPQPNFTEEDLDKFLAVVDAALYKTDADMVLDPRYIDETTRDLCATDGDDDSDGDGSGEKDGSGESGGCRRPATRATKGKLPKGFMPIPCALCLAYAEGKERSGCFSLDGRNINIIGYFGCMTREMEEAFKIVKRDEHFGSGGDADADADAEKKEEEEGDEKTKEGNDDSSSSGIVSVVDTKQQQEGQVVATGPRPNHIDMYLDTAILTSAGDRTLERVLVLAAVMLRHQFQTACRRVVVDRNMRRIQRGAYHPSLSHQQQQRPPPSAAGMPGAMGAVVSHSMPSMAPPPPALPVGPAAAALTSWSDPLFAVPLPPLPVGFFNPYSPPRPATPSDSAGGGSCPVGTSGEHAKGQPAAATADGGETTGELPLPHDGSGFFRTESSTPAGTPTTATAAPVALGDGGERPTATATTTATVVVTRPVPRALAVPHILTVTAATVAGMVPGQHYSNPNVMSGYATAGTPLGTSTGSAGSFVGADGGGGGGDRLGANNTISAATTAAPGPAQPLPVPLLDSDDDTISAAFLNRLHCISLSVESSSNNYSALKSMTENFAFLHCQVDLDPSNAVVHLYDLPEPTDGGKDGAASSGGSTSSRSSSVSGAKGRRKSSGNKGGNAAAAAAAGAVRSRSADPDCPLGGADALVPEEEQREADQTPAIICPRAGVVITMNPLYFAQAALWASCLFHFPARLPHGHWVQYKLKDECEQLRLVLQTKDTLIARWRQRDHARAGAYLGPHTQRVLSHVRALQEETERVRCKPAQYWAGMPLYVNQDARRYTLHRSRYGVMLIGVRSHASDGNSGSNNGSHNVSGSANTAAGANKNNGNAAGAQHRHDSGGAAAAAAAAAAAGGHHHNGPSAVSGGGKMPRGGGGQAQSGGHRHHSDMSRMGGGGGGGGGVGYLQQHDPNGSANMMAAMMMVMGGPGGPRSGGGAVPPQFFPNAVNNNGNHPYPPLQQQHSHSKRGGGDGGSRDWNGAAPMPPPFTGMSSTTNTTATTAAAVALPSGGMPAYNAALMQAYIGQNPAAAAALFHGGQAMAPMAQQQHQQQQQPVGFSFGVVPPTFAATHHQQQQQQHMMAMPPYFTQGMAAQQQQQQQQQAFAAMPGMYPAAVTAPMTAVSSTVPSNSNSRGGHRTAPPYPPQQQEQSPMSAGATLTAGFLGAPPTDPTPAATTSPLRLPPQHQQQQLMAQSQMLAHLLQLQQQQQQQQQPAGPQSPSMQQQQQQQNVAAYGLIQQQQQQQFLYALQAQQQQQQQQQPAMGGYRAVATPTPSHQPQQQPTAAAGVESPFPPIHVELIATDGSPVVMRTPSQPSHMGDSPLGLPASVSGDVWGIFGRGGSGGAPTLSGKPGDRYCPPLPPAATAAADLIKHGGFAIATVKASSLNNSSASSAGVPVSPPVQSAASPPTATVPTTGGSGSADGILREQVIRDYRELVELHKMCNQFQHQLEEVRGRMLWASASGAAADNNSASAADASELHSLQARLEICQRYARQKDAEVQASHESLLKHQHQQHQQQYQSPLPLRPTEAAVGASVDAMELQRAGRVRDDYRSAIFGTATQTK